MTANFIFTSASVTAGHPDKLCDQISDAIVDHFLQQDPYSRINAECAVASGVVFIAARFASHAVVDIPEVTRYVIENVGYNQPDFNAKDCTILTNFTELPPEEYVTADETQMSDAELDNVTAENHATVFGYACKQTPAMLPMPIWLAHRFARQLTQARESELISGLLPDGMSEVAIEYRDHNPERIHSMVLVASHNEGHSNKAKDLNAALIKYVVEPVVEQQGIRIDKDTNIYINPQGPFFGGGPKVHAGLTGRKVAVDGYGQYCRMGSAALSGKDPLRIDRTGNYIARYAAKNVVAAGLAEECEVLVSYCIGQAKPVTVQINTFGTGNISDHDIATRLLDVIDFRPGAVIKQFNLRTLPANRDGFYRRLAVFGHVGRDDIELPWEKTDLIKLLTG
ncbi:methionine adenosyltransferase [Nitrosomonas communis]|uniref:methionine adenosyltransferase n=1 Tax=Nitrosomonas communis TaxID=44574 RepID=UPI0026EC45FC|nr:methionine adenosyltransferase [Nitrosomonas communis]MCO6427374.1 methionine adenosyltransferase [Nitrosomonas communis]